MRQEVIKLQNLIDRLQQSKKQVEDFYQERTDEEDYPKRPRQVSLYKGSHAFATTKVEGRDPYGARSHKGEAFEDVELGRFELEEAIRQSHELIFAALQAEQVRLEYELAKYTLTKAD